MTENEIKLFKAIGESAKIGDTGKEFTIDDLEDSTDLDIKSIKGILSSLKKKGLILCYSGESYFDGELTEKGIEELKSY